MVRPATTSMVPQMLGSSAFYGDWNSTMWYTHENGNSFAGKISQQRGSHYLKVGAEYRYHVGIGIFPNLMNFNFYPDTTANTYLSPDTAVSGDAHASFLLGVVDARSADASAASTIGPMPARSTSFTDTAT